MNKVLTFEEFIESKDLLYMYIEVVYNSNGPDEVKDKTLTYFYEMYVEDAKLYGRPRP